MRDKQEIYAAKPEAETLLSKGQQGGNDPTAGAVSIASDTDPEIMV